MGCSSSSPGASSNPRHSLFKHLVTNKQNVGYERDYEVVGTLGKGSFGSVYKVKSRKDGQLYAIKVIEFGGSGTSSSSSSKKNTGKKDTGEIDREMESCLRNELNLLRALDHPNIIKVYGIYENIHPNHNADSSLSIVLELCYGGDLYTREPYTEQHAQVILIQILDAIHYMHSRNILHRDLKHENVMFETTCEQQSRVKLIDFGLSCKSLRKVIHGTAGTIYTMAPEACRGETNRKSDLWSVGVIAFMLLSGGEMPFVGNTRKIMIENICFAKLSFDSPAWEGVSEEAKAFIKNLIQTYCEKRYTAQEALSDPWLKQEQKMGAVEDLSQTLVKKIGDNFETFSKASEFQKLALQAVAKRSNEEEIGRLRDAFFAMDPERTGTVTLSNMKRALGSQYSEKEVERLFRCVDVDETGSIEYTEFLAAAITMNRRLEEQKVALAFDVFDRDETGYISKKDLREILGSKADPEYVDRLVTQADKNGDGKISYQEFKSVFDQETCQSERSFRHSLSRHKT